MATPRSALQVIDRTLLVGIPLVLATAIIKFPTGTSTSLRWLGALAAAAWSLALLGTLGRAQFRRLIYPVIFIGIGAISLRTQGPMGGVGAAFSLAVLLAGAMSSRIALWSVVAIAIATLGLGAASLVASSAAVPPILQFEEVTVWIRVGLVVAILSWIAMQVLDSVIHTLEQSYERAVDAYQQQTETREQLDSSRQELDEAANVELVGRLAGGVAHDINNALTAILAASDLLGDKVADGAQRQSLAELEGASRQAAELVRDLLWIGRQFPPTTSSAQVETTVVACKQRLDRVGRKVTIDMRGLPSLRVALAPERLEQVLFRLILRAHRRGVTHLALVGRSVGATIELELRGESQSLSPANSLSHRPKAMSARLGMSAARQVIQQAGGTLSITESDDDLLVQLCLPMGEADKPIVPPHRGRTALVVDDEPLILGRLSKLVARRGYTVKSASSLAEAWPLLREGPDLLVTDLQLGDGRGEDLAIASFASAPERPIVVCSGFGADDKFRAQLRDAHIQFLTKPFTMAELEDTIPKAVV